MTPTPIILDCDPGHDDAIALLLAVASPEVELIGVTTVAGNQTLDKTTNNALRVLEFAGRDDLPVYAGPEAAERVFLAGLDTTMVGLDVTHRAQIKDEHTERMRVAGKVGNMVAQLMDFYARFHKSRYPDLEGSPMHDPVCVAHVIDPTLMRVLDAHIEVDCSGGPSWGRTNVD